MDWMKLWPDIAIHGVMLVSRSMRINYETPFKYLGTAFKDERERMLNSS